MKLSPQNLSLFRHASKAFQVQVIIRIFGHVIYDRKFPPDEPVADVSDELG